MAASLGSTLDPVVAVLPPLGGRTCALGPLAVEPALAAAPCLLDGSSPPPPHALLQAPPHAAASSSAAVQEPRFSCRSAVTTVAPPADQRQRGREARTEQQ